MEIDGLLVPKYAVSSEDISDLVKMRCRSDPIQKRMVSLVLLTACSVPLSIGLLIALFDLGYGLSLVGLFAIGFLVYTRGRPRKKVAEEVAKRFADEWEQRMEAKNISVSLYGCGAGCVCVKSNVLDAKIPLDHVYRVDEFSNTIVIEPKWGPTILVPRKAFSSQDSYDSFLEAIREGKAGKDGEGGLFN